METQTIVIWNKYFAFILNNPFSVSSAPHQKKKTMNEQGNGENDKRIEKEPARSIKVENSILNECLSSDLPNDQEKVEQYKHWNEFETELAQSPMFCPDCYKNNVFNVKKKGQNVLRVLGSGTSLMILEKMECKSCDATCYILNKNVENFI